MEKGKIILIEGTDKSGKKTQSDLLINRLLSEGIPAKKMSFPKYDTPTGRVVGQCYLGKEGLGSGDIAWFGEANNVNPHIASMYFAADRFAAREEIKEIIQSGTNLILDRYVESNIAHQGGKAKNDIEREEIVKFIQILEYRLLGLPHPDNVIFLHMPYQVGMELGKGMNERPDSHEASIEHLKRAEETYIWLANKYGWETIECAPGGISPLDINDIHEKIYKHVKRNL